MSHSCLHIPLYSCQLALMQKQVALHVFQLGNSSMDFHKTKV